MENGSIGTKPVKKSRKKKRKKARAQAVLSVISVRLTDDEKERIDEIMRAGSFKRYSDIVRMAIHLYRGPNGVTHGRSDIYH